MTSNGLRRTRFSFGSGRAPLILALLAWPALGEADSDNAKNPRAVEEILSGARTTANAAWWGFDQEDSTEALQSAIDSGAKEVIVPNMGRDWNVRPISLAGDQELVFEEGVVVTAKRGEYRKKGESVFTARDVSNLTLRGYGATVRMWKEDYIVGSVLVNLDWHRWFGQYEKAEWRMALSLRGCENVQVEGLTLRDSGGDGVYVGGGGSMNYCKNVRLKDVVCDNNYRQGISIVGADGLLAEDCAFNNTWGTPPSSGVDIEPNGSEEIVNDIVFRNCTFKDNYGDGIEVFLRHLRSPEEDISIRFENCHVSSKHGTGIRVTKIADDGPGGIVEFKNCTVDGTVGYGIKVQDKSADKARVRFVDCTVRNAARDRNYAAEWTPVWLHLFRPNLTTKFGGIEFVNCLVEDDRDRPAVVYRVDEGEHGLFDVTGTLRVQNPHGVRTKFGEKREGVSLEIQEVSSP